MCCVTSTERAISSSRQADDGNDGKEGKQKKTHVGDNHPGLTAALVELGDLGDGALLAGGEVDGRVDAFGLVVRGADEGVLAVSERQNCRQSRPVEHRERRRKGGEKGNVRKVRKVTLVLQPLSSGGNLISRALTPDPQEAAKVLELELGRGVGKLLSCKVRVERREKLETGRGRGDGEFGGRVGGGSSAGEVGGVTCERGRVSGSV